MVTQTNMFVLLTMKPNAQLCDFAARQFQIFDEVSGPYREMPQIDPLPMVPI